MAAGLTNTIQSALLGAASAVIGVDRVSTGSTGTAGASTKTISHTTGAGANRLMLVSVSIGNSSATEESVSSITYGGQSLTSVSVNPGVSGGGGTYPGRPRTELWRLVNPNSGTTNVVVTLSGTRGFEVGVMTFTNVDQTTPLGSAVTNYDSGASTRTATVTVASSSGEWVVDVVGLAKYNSTTVPAVTAGSGQTQWWQTNDEYAAAGTLASRGAGSTKPGSASVTMTSSWSATGYPWSIIAVPIKPVSGGGANVSSFTQTPAFSMPFNMVSGSVVRVTNVVSIVSGAMPGNPTNIQAVLSVAGTPYLTLTNAAFITSAGRSNLVWSGMLTNTVNMTSNQAISLVVTTFQSGVTFKIDYNSTNAPSAVYLPTTNIIAIADMGIYNGAYPGGTNVSSALIGDTLYVRVTATDPFGAYDITSLKLAVTDPGNATFDVTLSNSYVVASNSYSKTYEYAWPTSVTQGLYSIAATVNEGTEGIKASAARTVDLGVLDLGTPSTTEFTLTSNGTNTSVYNTNQTVFIRVTDLDQNMNPGVAETVSVILTNSSGDFETNILTEVGVNSGVFTGSVAASSTTVGTPGNNVIYAPAGSVFHVYYVDPNDPTDTSSATAVVPLSPGVTALSVSKVLVSPAGGRPKLGEPVQFDIVVLNSGAMTAQTVRVTDNYPTNQLNFTSAIPLPTNATYAGSLIWTNVGPLLPGQQTTISTFFLATNAIGVATNTAIALDVEHSVAATNRVTVTNINPGLVVTKSVLPPSTGTNGVGDQVTFRILVKNAGASSLPVMPLVDTFDGVYYSYVSSTLPTNASGYGILLWNVGPLSPGGVITNDVTMKVMGSGNPAWNTASIEGVVDGNGDPVPDSSSTTSLVTKASSVSGSVYDDINTNGVYNAGTDLPLQAVTVSLYTELSNGIPGTLVGIVSTLANGSYEFLNLPTGRYVVVETDLAGYASWTPLNNRLVVSASNLVAYSGNNFFDYVPPPVSYATIKGGVYHDVSGNGSTGSPLSGVTVDLVQDVNSNGVADVGESVVQSTLTAGNGNYTFAGLVAGNYVVRETDPAGYISVSDTYGLNNNLIWVQALAGMTYTNNNFFDAQPGTISGGVWRDINKNGTQDAADTNALVGVHVILYTTNGVAVATNTTDAAGGYSFSNLIPNVYVVVETDPAGYVSTTMNVVTIALASGQVSAGNNFLDAIGGAIGDRVWLDENGNGIQDVGEAGLANVRVVLLATNGVALATNVTGADGGYLFAGLLPDAYVVRVDTNSLAAGLSANQTFDPDATTNNATTVTLVAGAQPVLTADFGYNWGPTTNVVGNTGTGSIGDRLWIDADGDGTQDPGELGMGGVSVTLVNLGPDGLPGTVDDATNTTTTAADGSYSFTGLAAAAYVVIVNGGVVPSGYSATGDPDGVYDNRTTTPIMLPPGDVFVNADFGYKPSTVGAIIGDSVYFDANADGTKNGNDYGLAGVAVSLLNSNSVVVATTVTSTNGAYQFADVPAGTYTVWVSDTHSVLVPLRQSGDPDGAGSLDSRSTLTVAGAGSYLDRDFGYTAAGQTPSTGLIGDTIYLDVNTNGVVDSGEGIQGVTVRLTDTNGLLLATMVTDIDGHYTFGGLMAGSYVVKVVTNTLPGTLGQLSNTVDPDGGTGDQATVTLSAGQLNLAQDFGYADQTGPNTIAGMLWVDANADGVRVAGESNRYAGVNVVLLDTNGNVVATTVTDAGGNYTFRCVPDGTLVVDVTDTAQVLGGAWHSQGSDSKSDPDTVTLTGSQTATVDFGYYKAGAALGNRVWFDANKNGIQDAGETGLNNVRVILRIAYPNGTTNVVGMLTDTNGYYGFSNLLLDENFDGVGSGEPGYALSVVMPGTKVGLTVVGATNQWFDSNSNGTVAVTSKGLTSVGILANPANESTNATYDFGLVWNQTLARLIGFKAFSRDGAVVVSWETSEELDTAGFYLERLSGDQYRPVHEELIPSYEMGGGVYEQVDLSAQAGGSYTYRLVELETSGNRLYLGPYVVTVDGLALSFDEWSRSVFAGKDLFDPAVSGAEADPDGDGMNNLAEFRAGTRPLDKSSALRIHAFDHRSGQGVSIRWLSTSNRVYTIERSLNLIEGFVPMTNGIQATPPENEQFDESLSFPNAVFYRIQVE